MIALETHRDGVILPVRAHAGATRSGIAGQHVGALKVNVTAAPEKGRANEAIVDVLAKALGLRRAQIELIAGPTSSQKRFLLRGAALKAIQARLAALVGE